MKRRGFLGTLVAVAVAPFLPKTQPHAIGSFGEPRTINRDWFADMGPMPLRVGDTITVKLPARFKATDSLQPHLHQAYAEFDAMQRYTITGIV